MKSNQLIQIVEAAIEYIDALPDEVVHSLPTMPGFDRDWFDSVLEDSKKSWVVSEYGLKLINSHSPLLSMLYDLGLPPEVLQSSDQYIAFSSAVRTYCYLNQIEISEQIIIK